MRPELVKAPGTISAGVAEGLDNKVKLTTTRKYGFRTFDAVKTALYHNLGWLPRASARRFPVFLGVPPAFQRIFV